jgi:hypothetical protein
MRIKPIVLLVVIVFTAVVIAMSFTIKHKHSIAGAWRIVEVKTVKSDGTYSYVFPKESEAIFTGSYYSLCWTSHDFKADSISQLSTQVHLPSKTQSLPPKQHLL